MITRSRSKSTLIFTERWFGAGVLGVLTLALVSGLLAAPASSVAASSVPTPAEPAAAHSANPDQACAACHWEIFDRYEQTPMARGSGRAADGLLEGSFVHQPSKISYRVSASHGGEMTFDRAASGAHGEDTSLHGTRALLFYIGSNHRGRTYLYREGMQWFELPINFYAATNSWDMAPAFDNVTAMPASLPTDASCLHCHATAVARPLPEAANAFAAEPFAQGGIGCAACHGDASAHLAAQGHAPITNPGKLPVARRDSACIQCHLEGDETVYKPGTSLAEFKPGDDLAQRAVYFVKASQAAGGGRATSQYEALLRSACKRASGDKLTCTTCHDPHGSPAPAERVAWFRARCLDCHNTPAIAQAHFPEQPDCASCHMPSRKTTDISHEQVTDHNVQARPKPAHAAAPLLRDAFEELVPVGGAQASDRDLGLAYAQLASSSGSRTAGERAQRLLRRAEAAGADDAPVHTQLGFLDQRSGDRLSASREYALALARDPFDTTALANLAVLDATGGQTRQAIDLLERSVAADPAKLAPGMNLAFLRCSVGQAKESEAILAQLTHFDPDDPTLRTFRQTGVYAGQRCPRAGAPAGSHASR